MGIKKEGRSFLSRIFVKGSKTEYEIKKIVSVALNCNVDSPRSVERPAILALLILARSRKASK